jgi:hypothetical protein
MVDWVSMQFVDWVDGRRMDADGSDGKSTLSELERFMWVVPMAMGSFYLSRCTGTGTVGVSPHGFHLAEMGLSLPGSLPTSTKMVSIFSSFRQHRADVGWDLQVSRGTLPAPSPLNGVAGN